MNSRFYHVVTIVGFFFSYNDKQEDRPACRARIPAEAANIFLPKTAVPPAVLMFAVSVNVQQASMTDCQWTQFLSFFFRLEDFKDAPLHYTHFHV